MGENFNPITAQQAKEAADTFVNAQDREELTNIYNQIRAQIALGKYGMIIYKQLSKSNKDFLKNQGFEVYEGPLYCCTSSHETQNEVFTAISWRNG